MPSYQPRIRFTKPVEICSKCKKKTPLVDLFIAGIDESNYAITQQACKNPICRDCLSR